MPDVVIPESANVIVTGGESMPAIVIRPGESGAIKLVGSGLGAKGADGLDGTDGVDGSTDATTLNGLTADQYLQEPTPTAAQWILLGEIASAATSSTVKRHNLTLNNTRNTIGAVKVLATYNSLGATSGVAEVTAGFFSAGSPASLANSEVFASHVGESSTFEAGMSFNASAERPVVWLEIPQSRARFTVWAQRGYNAASLMSAGVTLTITNTGVEVDAP